MDPETVTKFSSFLGPARGQGSPYQIKPSDLEMERPPITTTKKVPKRQQTLDQFLEEYGLSKHQLSASFLNPFRRKTNRKYYVNYPEGYFILYVDKTTNLVLSKEFHFYRKTP